MIGTLFNAAVSLAKSLIAKEPARVIGWGSTAAVAGAMALARLAGVELPVDVVAGVSAIAGFIVAELIRRFVYAPATVEAMQAE